MTRFPMRYVEWDDSSSISHWHTMKQALEHEVDRCVTVGFLLAETEDAVTLSMSLTNRKDAADDSAGDTICIPKVAITKSFDVVAFK